MTTTAQRAELRGLRRLRVGMPGVCVAVRCSRCGMRAASAWKPSWCGPCQRELRKIVGDAGMCSVWREADEQYARDPRVALSERVSPWT